MLAAARYVGVNWWEGVERLCWFACRLDCIHSSVQILVVLSTAMLLPDSMVHL